MPRQWNDQDNVNTWGTHHGKLQGGEYASQWVLLRHHSKDIQFRPLLKTSKKGNAKSTMEGMAYEKPRTTPSGACQIYGRVPAKIFHTLFRKRIGRGKQDNERFSKI